MKHLLSGILLLAFLLFSSVIPRQEKLGRFEVVSMYNSTYAISSDYLLPDARKMMDTVTVVSIRDGRVALIDRYVFVDRKIIDFNDK
jgi:hypothetical protein